VNTYQAYIESFIDFLVRSLSLVHIFRSQYSLLPVW